MKCSGRQATPAFVAIFFLLSPFISVSAETSNASSVHLKDVSDSEMGWVLAPALNGGYNKLLTGYDGYKDLGNLGLDLYAQPSYSTDPDEYANWRENTIFRLSFNWFPLQVPNGVNGLKEDIYSADFDYLYAFNLRGEDRNWYRPFLGFGVGLYKDVLVLDTPATGKVSSGDTHFGYELSVGLLCPVWKGSFPVRLVPEIRYHRIKSVDAYASNITYQLGVCYWPRGKKE